jgi:hypothetical protein
MPQSYTELPASAQTAYAQLFEAALAADHVRSVSDLSGSFSAKTVKGRTYWYYQCTQPSGVLTQHYVGPDSPAVRRLIEGAKVPGALAALEPLIRAAHALGCASLIPKHERVLRRLAEYGFFRAGGILVGTHAFLAFGNMLGVRWGRPGLTHDIDFAHAGRALSLALPSTLEVRTSDAIDSLAMGFLPITQLAGKSGASFLNPKEPEFRLDFLTARHRGGEEPFFHRQLHVALQPLRFMEFSLEQVEQAVVFSRARAVLVNVPEPARFALHKLIVYGERTGSYRAKAGKDLSQAGSLLAYLWEHRRAAAEAALDDLRGRGRGWTSRFAVGAQALMKAHTELQQIEGLPAALIPASSGNKRPRIKQTNRR